MGVGYDDVSPEEQRKAQEILQQQRRDDFRHLMQSPQGRRLLWELISDCGVYASLPVQDHAIMAYQEGRRAIGLQLLAQANGEPALFRTMQNENAKYRG